MAGLPVIDHNNNDNKPSRVKIGLSLATLQEERWKRDRDYLEEKVVECGGNLFPYRPITTIIYRLGRCNTS